MQLPYQAFVKSENAPAAAFIFSEFFCIINIRYCISGGCMKFCEILNEYIERLGCMAKDVANASGVSAATLSRYRSGERLPDTSSEAFEKLCIGIALISEEKNIADITEVFVREHFLETDDFLSADTEHMLRNFDTLVSTLNISITRLCRDINYDAYTVFRFRNGTRRPAEPDKFAAAVAGYVIREMDSAQYQAILAELLDNAHPLMDIYRSSNKNELNAFLLADSREAGKRRTILSALPLYTMDDALLRSILKRHGLDGEEIHSISESAAAQRHVVEKILETGSVEDEISEITKEELETQPLTLDLSCAFCSCAFCEKDIQYTAEEYFAHLESTERFAAEHQNYTLKKTSSHTFRNLQIYIHEGRWTMVSKGKAPAIHFIIHHPKLRSAIENFIPPVVEKK